LANSKQQSAVSNQQDGNCFLHSASDLGRIRLQEEAFFSWCLLIADR